VSTAVTKRRRQIKLTKYLCFKSTLEPLKCDLSYIPFRMCNIPYPKCYFRESLRNSCGYPSGPPKQPSHKVGLLAKEPFDTSGN
jgi:hypothetical protein